MNRGDIYWVNLSSASTLDSKQLHQCVIVSASAINRARHTVVVVPLSETAPVREPIVVPLHCEGKRLSAFCDQVRTINKSHLVNAIGTVSLKEMDTLDNSLRQVLAL